MSLLENHRSASTRMRTLISVIVCLILATAQANQQQNDLSGSFIYTIESNRRVGRFLNARNGQRIKSNVMLLNDIHFQLHFYPNGKFENQEHQFIAHLCVVRPDKRKVSAMLADWTLSIHQTNYSQHVRNRHFSQTSQCRGFAVMNNQEIIKQLKQHASNKISFSISIVINQIFESQHIISSHIPIQVNRFFSFSWRIRNDINEHILEQMLYAQHQQTFLSEPFDDLFFLSLTPNGYHQNTQGTLDMFLHLIALPDEISKLRMKCNLSIGELQIRHEIKADWSNEDGGWGWSAGKYPLDLLREYVSSSNPKKITPAVECETLAIFDENAAAVTLNKRWQTFNVPAKISNITHLYGWNPEKSVMDGVCEENAKCLFIGRIFRRPRFHL